MNRNGFAGTMVARSVVAPESGENVGTSQQGRTMTGTAAITNGHDSSPVTFSLRVLPSGGWETKTLRPRQSEAFRVGAAGGEFWAQAAGKAPVRYELRAGTRYVVYWDVGRGVWDLYEDKRG